MYKSLGISSHLVLALARLWGLTGPLASEYVKKEALHEVLAPCIQMAGGQLPRYRELPSLCCVNAKFGPRGIYVYNGAMVYITRHHKVNESRIRGGSVSPALDRAPAL